MKIVIFLLLVVLLLLGIIALAGAMILLYDEVVDVIEKYRGATGYDNKRKNT